MGLPRLHYVIHLSHLMRKPTICLGKNKGADQLCSNCEVDQRLCFRYSDSTVPLLLKSEISSLQPSSVLVQLGLCRTCSETTLLVFPRGGSNFQRTNLTYHPPYAMFHHKTQLLLHKAELPCIFPACSIHLPYYCTKWLPPCGVHLHAG